jgi:hypothetical protein
MEEPNVEEVLIRRDGETPCRITGGFSRAGEGMSEHNEVT